MDMNRLYASMIEVTEEEEATKAEVTGAGMIDEGTGMGTWVLEFGTTEEALEVHQLTWEDMEEVMQGEVGVPSLMVRLEHVCA